VHEAVIIASKNKLFLLKLIITVTPFKIKNCKYFVVNVNLFYDIIINNAGINPLHYIEDVTPNNIMRINYLAPLEILQQCLPYMKKNNYGRVINMGSIWLDLAKSKRHYYSASKNALHSLTKSITAEYSMYNVLSNTISPGYIDTVLTHINNNSEELDKIKKQIPQQRMGTPEEVAELVYFLTVNNTYITGQNIIIDGGFSCTIQ